MSEIFEPKRIIVTGGAGFIGSNFVHWVVDNQPDVHVVVLDALTYAGNLDNLAGIPEERMTFVHGDICDEALLEEIVPGVDGLIHISQIADHRIEKPGDVLAEGDMVDVKITDIDMEHQKVSLSIRALLEEPADMEDEEA